MAKLASRKIMESEQPAGEYVPYSHHVTDTIISTGDGTYLTVWKLEGRSHQSASEEELFSWLEELNNVIKGIGSENLSIWSHMVRRRVQEYPECEYENVFCHQLNERYKESFHNINLMVNELYVTLVYRAENDKVLAMMEKAERVSTEEKAHRVNGMIRNLEDINRTFAAATARYKPEVQAIYYDNGYTYSSAMEFLAFLVNGERTKFPVCRDRFSEYTVFNRPLFSDWGELGEIRCHDAKRFFGIVEIKEYTDTTEPGHLNVLMQTDYEFVLTQSFKCLSKYAAQGYLQRHQRNLIDASDAAVGQIEQISLALDQLVSGNFIMGEHHATLTVFGDSPANVRDHLASAKADFLDVGIMPHVVDMALESAFWAQLPANWEHRPRPAPITSYNFLSFASMHNFMAGKPTGNPWGPAVTILKTISGSPLYFNFHASRPDADDTDKKMLGNTAVIGASGGGKTVLMGFLIAQAQKFAPKAVIFDKDRGMDILVRAIGGCYSALKMGEPTGFNPLQMEATEANMLFLKRFVIKLVESSGDRITHRDEQEISQALKSVMKRMDPEHRNLTMMLQFLPNPITDDQDARPTVHARLLKWTQGNDYGWLFDNPTDSLDLSKNRTFGFDVTEFLDHPDVRAPLTMYILHRSESMIDGEPFIYMFDEFWKMLGDSVFEDLAKNKVKTIRKQNGVFVFATQEPDDALISPIGKTLIQQCATYVFLPNPKATREDYVDGLKLSEAEFNIVKGFGDMSRRFLIKQGDNSAVAELNLYGFNDELKILSGTTDNAELLDNIRAEVGDDPRQWMPVFFERT